MSNPFCCHSLPVTKQRGLDQILPGHLQAKFGPILCFLQVAVGECGWAGLGWAGGGAERLSWKRGLGAGAGLGLERAGPVWEFGRWGWAGEGTELGCGGWGWAGGAGGWVVGGGLGAGVGGGWAGGRRPPIKFL